MDMPLPNRQYAIVIGSHEDDIRMTSGLSDLKEQISVGYLDLTEELPQSLPVSLRDTICIKHLPGPLSLSFSLSLSGICRPI